MEEDELKQKKFVKQKLSSITMEDGELKLAEWRGEINGDNYKF